MSTKTAIRSKRLPGKPMLRNCRRVLLGQHFTGINRQLQNGYPPSIITHNENKPNNPVPIVPKNIIILLHVPHLDLHQITKHLNYSLIQYILEHTPHQNLFSIIEQPGLRSRMSNVIYSANCWDCTGFYISKTKLEH